MNIESNIYPPHLRDPRRLARKALALHRGRVPLSEIMHGREGTQHQRWPNEEMETLLYGPRVGALRRLGNYLARRKRAPMTR